MTSQIFSNFFLDIDREICYLIQCFLELFEKAEINHIFLDKQFLFDYTQNPSGVKQIKGFYPNHF